MTAERPLTPQARLALQSAAAATILGFYLAATVSMALLSVLLLLGTVALVGAARVGLARYVANIVRPTIDLLGLFGRGLWLRQATRYRITLDQAEAPRLFATVADLARQLNVTPPQTVVLEMHAGAWVQLKGLRRREGHVVLGVGYDLLAGLTLREAEAVLAHELGHMRFVQRGLSRWLGNGLARLANVTEMIGGYQQRRAVIGKSHLTEWCLAGFQPLTLRAARLVATCSRQDEFEADSAAASICGADALRSALLKLESLHDAVGLIPWPERNARLQAGEGYGEWLVQELSQRVEPPLPDNLPQHSEDPYSTHPSLRDRIANLPSEGKTESTGSALSLLASQDRSASRLADEIQRVSAIEERKDTRRAFRDARKWSRRTALNGWHLIGAVVTLVGFIGLLLVFTDPMGTAFNRIVWLAVMPVGILLYRAGTYRDRRTIAVPVFGTFTTWKPYDTSEALEAAEQKVVEEVEARVKTGGSKKLADRLTDEAYGALAERDYLRAHVSARLALDKAPKSIEARLAYGIAAGGIGNRQQATGSLDVIRSRTGLKSRSTLWGSAWALVMLEDWSCEGLLLWLTRKEPDNPTFAAMLALAQLHRGKLQSAVEQAQKAAGLSPGNEAITELLVGALLTAGRSKEALAVSARLEAVAQEKANTALLMVRVRLMATDLSGASEWAARLVSLDDDGSWYIPLASVYAQARHFDHANEYYQRAVTTPFAPQAHLGLAGLAALAGKASDARAHYLLALRFENARFVMKQSAPEIFRLAIGSLNALARERLACAAWIATIPEESPLDLAGRSLVVFATSESAARENLSEIMRAMESEGKLFDPEPVVWRRAPADQQPVRPVFPGVQGITG